MSYEAMNLEELAAYLHLHLAQVRKLVDRGDIPGRKVGGEWRFSPTEVHDWIERRIGLAGEEGLLQVENALQRPPGASRLEHIVLADLLPLAAIAVPLPARTRNSVISRMTRLAADTGLLWDAVAMETAVREREEMHPTALDCGVALLHPRRPMPQILSEPLLALGLTESPIPFGGEHGSLTDIFFLICSEDDRQHLRVLARLSRVIAVPSFLESLRAVQSGPEALDVVRQYEQELPE